MAKILVVEDDTDFHQNYKESLEARDGHRLLFAVSSEEGIRALKDNPDTDLVILDHILQYGVPCIDFLSFLHNVWRDQRGQKAPKKPLLVTASSIAFNAVGAECVFRKHELLDHLGKVAGPDNHINKLLRETASLPRRQTVPADPAPG